MTKQDNVTMRYARAETKKASTKKAKTKKTKIEKVELDNFKHKRIHITKVVSRNFLMDIWAQLQNLVGTNLNVYERMVDKAFNQIDLELEDKGIELSWYRHEVTQLTNGAVVVVLYGEEK